MSTIGKVCARCQVELYPKKNGVGAIAMGDSGPEAIYDADLWRCPNCGLEVVLDFGNKPIREHFHPDFAAVVAGYSHTIEFWMDEAAMERTASKQPECVCGSTDDHHSVECFLGEAS